MQVVLALLRWAVSCKAIRIKLLVHTHGVDHVETAPTRWLRHVLGVAVLVRSPSLHFVRPRGLIVLDIRAAGADFLAHDYCNLGPFPVVALRTASVAAAAAAPRERYGHYSRVVGTVLDNCVVPAVAETAAAGADLARCCCSHHQKSFAQADYPPQVDWGMFRRVLAAAVAGNCHSLCWAERKSWSANAQGLDETACSDEQAAH